MWSISRWGDKMEKVDRSIVEGKNVSNLFFLL